MSRLRYSAFPWLLCAQASNTSHNWKQLRFECELLVFHFIPPVWLELEVWNWLYMEENEGETHHSKCYAELIHTILFFCVCVDVDVCGGCVCVSLYIVACQHFSASAEKVSLFFLAVNSFFHFRSFKCSESRIIYPFTSCDYYSTLNMNFWASLCCMLDPAMFPPIHIRVDGWEVREKGTRPPSNITHTISSHKKKRRNIIYRKREKPELVRTETLQQRR